MQMENDYSIRAYSDFPDNDAALRAVLGSFARGAPGDARLLVKVHPLDPGLKRWGARLARLAAAGRGRRAGAPAGWRAAGRSGDPRLPGVVTINSTLAVQAIMLGRPVLALGRAIYQVPGLAWQGAADEFWQAAPAPDPLLAAAFLRGIAACLHVRGRFYGRPGWTSRWPGRCGGCTSTWSTSPAGTDGVSAGPLASSRPRLLVEAAPLAEPHQPDQQPGDAQGENAPAAAPPRRGSRSRSRPAHASRSRRHSRPGRAGAAAGRW